MQLSADECDTLEEALRTVALPFFLRPNATWLRCSLTKLSKRSLRGCVCWRGARPAELKARAYWPEDGGGPRIEVWHWRGDAVTTEYAWRELLAQALGDPPHSPIVPSRGAEDAGPRLFLPVENDNTSASYFFASLLDMLVVRDNDWRNDLAMEAAMSLSAAPRGLWVLPEVLETLQEDTAALPDDIR